MEKKKKAWQSPRMEVQLFMPQEYCAICLQVACIGGMQGGNDWNGYVDNNGNPHTCWTVEKNGGRPGQGCGHAENQVFRLYSNSNIEMWEVNIPAATGGTIESTTRICTIDGWGNGKKFSLEELQSHANQTIYWTTSGVQTDANGNTKNVTFLHYGTLSMTNPRSVNAS